MDDTTGPADQHHKKDDQEIHHGLCCEITQPIDPRLFPTFNCVFIVSLIDCLLLLFFFFSEASKRERQRERFTLRPIIFMASISFFSFSVQTEITRNVMPYIKVKGMKIGKK